MNKRKYPETNGWGVYIHCTPDNMKYVGIIQREPWKRWNPSLYKGTSFYPHIEKWGWENIEHCFLINGLTYKQALQWEDRLIKMYRKLGCCINKKGSGGWKKNKKKVSEYNSEFNKIRYSRPADIIYMRVKDYNRYHPNDKKETPSEAKQKYLQWGYIPNYIKNDDIIVQSHC